MVNVTWQLNPNNPFIPKKGTNKVKLFATIDWYWVGWHFYVVVAVDDAIVNKNGKCHAVFHVNGSGNGM